MNKENPLRIAPGGLQGRSDRAHPGWGDVPVHQSFPASLLTLLYVPDDVQLQHGKAFIIRLRACERQPSSPKAGEELMLLSGHEHAT